MAAGILALLSKSGKGKPSSSSGDSPAGLGDATSSKPLDAKAQALRSMWANMKAGDFEAAAIDAQDLYDACHGMESEEDEGGERPSYPDFSSEEGGELE